jgi:hypothetical protein
MRSMDEMIKYATSVPLPRFSASTPGSLYKIILNCSEFRFKICFKKYLTGDNWMAEVPKKMSLPLSPYLWMITVMKPKTISIIFKIPEKLKASPT